MIIGFGGATIWSADINKSLRAFYTDVMGMKVRIDTPEFVVFGEENVAAFALGTHSDVHGRNQDPARTMVGFVVDSAQGEYDRLKAAGVEFVDPPQDFGQLIITTLKDPEGNYVQLFEMK